jgi:hypothetical protein
MSALYLIGAVLNLICAAISVLVYPHLDTARERKFSAAFSGIWILSAVLLIHAQMGISQ